MALDCEAVDVWLLPMALDYEAFDARQSPWCWTKKPSGLATPHGAGLRSLCQNRTPIDATTGAVHLPLASSMVARLSSQSNCEGAVW